MSARLSSILMFGSIDPEVCNASMLHLAGVANAFAASGVSVRLLAPRSPPQSQLRQALRRDVALIEFASPRFIGLGRIRNLGPLFALAPLIAQIRRARPDVFYVRTNLLSWMLYPAVRRKNIVTIAEHNGLIADELRGAAALLWLPARMAQVLEARLADYSRAVTVGLAERLISLNVPHERIRTIANGTDVEQLRPLAREQALSALALSPTDVHVAFLGTLQWWQGVETLIRAFALARRQCPNLRLLIGGTGPQLAQLRQITDELGVATFTHFLGHVPFERRQLVLSAMDIACFPATAKRNMAQGVSPLKIRDYAAAGRAILSAQLPGLEDLERAGAAVLHNADDIEDLAAKIVALAKDADARKRLGERAREFALKHYAWSEVAKAIASAVQMRIG